ncbi:MAG: hypothetical protein EKK35_23610 [Bradyrhizobiaceae bacterium]|nr:MAG: hypothetical protein EKK35_23610 [Bradyrhizobiaceae bacterium]
MQKRRRFSESLQDRLTAFAADMKEKAAKAPPGPERDDLLKRARQAEAAVHLEQWATSPGLQPPK